MALLCPNAICQDTDRHISMQIIDVLNANLSAFDDDNSIGGTDCFEFVYPIAVSTGFESGFTVKNDENLKAITPQLSGLAVLEVKYPLTFLDTSGNIQTLKDNQALLNLLSDCYESDEKINTIPRESER